MDVDISFYDGPEDDMSSDTLEQIKSLYDISFKEEISSGSDFEISTNGSSFIVASTGELVLGYLDHYRLDNRIHEDVSVGLESFFYFRECVKRKDPDLLRLMKYCEKNSKQKVDGTMILAMGLEYDRLAKINLEEDILLDTMVVHPDFRRKGIAKTLMECFYDYSCNGNTFCYTRNTNKPMQHILPESGFVPLFQFGPFYLDGSCYQIWVKEKEFS